MEYIKTALTTLGGGAVSFANFKLMLVNVTEQVEMLNGMMGIIVGCLTAIYLVFKIMKVKNDKNSSK